MSQVGMYKKHENTFNLIVLQKYISFSYIFNVFTGEICKSNTTKKEKSQTIVYNLNISAIIIQNMSNFLENDVLGNIVINNRV